MSLLDALPFSWVGRDQSFTPPDLPVPTVDVLAARTGLPGAACHCAHDSRSYPRRAHDTTSAAGVEGRQGTLPESYDGGLAALAAHALSTNGEVVEWLYCVAESVASQGTTFDPGLELLQ